MIKKLILSALTASGLALASVPAHAHGFVAVDIGLPGIVVAPAPFYGPPAPVAPVVYGPGYYGPGFYGRGGWGYYPHWDHGRYYGWDHGRNGGWDHGRGDSHPNHFTHR
jgi:hypothetical protein